MQRPEECADEDQDIPLVEGEAGSGAEQINSNEGADRAQPDVQRWPAFKKERLDNGDEHHIETGDEAGIGSGGVADSGLLQAACDHQNGSGGEDPIQLPAGGFLTVVDEGQQNQSAEQKAQPVEEKDAKTPDGDALDDESRSPDEGDEEEGEIGGKAFIQKRLLEVGCAVRAAGGLDGDLCEAKGAILLGRLGRRRGFGE